MTKIVHPIGALVGEVVRIKWVNFDTGETLEEDHTAPPKETWRARAGQSETQADFYPPSRYGSKL